MTVVNAFFPFLRPVPAVYFPPLLSPAGSYPDLWCDSGSTESFIQLKSLQVQQPQADIGKFSSFN